MAGSLRLHACVLCACALVGRGLEASKRARADRFDSFVRRHGRSYGPGSVEYQARQALFEARLAGAELHNSQPGRRWTHDAWNAFADRTDEELSALLGWRGPAAPPEAGLSLLARGQRQRRKDCELPEEWSWGGLNSSHRVRDQGTCGSCSALAVALALEVHHEIYRGQTRTFSPQEFISCVQNPEACGGEGGCKGGFMELHMSYAARHGCHQEHEYAHRSWIAGDAGQCTALPKVDSGYVNTHPGVYQAPPAAPGSAFGMEGYERLPINRAEPLMRALVDRGPVVVALAARPWFAYGGGIFDACSKGAEIDHAVVLLGFGKSAETPYWLIANSWGSGWGEGGRIRLLRRSIEEEEAWCGMDRHPELGAACSRNRDGSWKPKPLAPVEVCGTCSLLYNPVVPLFAGSSRAATELAAARQRCGGDLQAVPTETIALVSS